MTCSNLYGGTGRCTTPITLPVSQGPAGASGSDGSDGVGIIHNSWTSYAIPDTLTKYTFHSWSITADTIEDVGDILELEALFLAEDTIGATDFIIKFGSTEILTFTLNPVHDTYIRLKARIHVSASTPSEVVEKFAYLHDYPTAEYFLGYDTYTAGTELGIASNQTVYIMAQKGTGGTASDITLINFSAKLYNK